MYASSASSPSPGVTLSNYAAQTEAKRRRLRKGTHSCWECKRRKTKCITNPLFGTATCNGCRRRGTQCISQEYPEDTSHDDLLRLEALHSAADKQSKQATPDGRGTREEHGILTPVSAVSGSSRQLAFFQSSEVCYPAPTLSARGADCVYLASTCWAWPSSWIAKQT
jgi:hypothetical protein